MPDSLARVQVFNQCLTLNTCLTVQPISEVSPVMGDGSITSADIKHMKLLLQPQRLLLRAFVIGCIVEVYVSLKYLKSQPDIFSRMLATTR